MGQVLPQLLAITVAPGEACLPSCCDTDQRELRTQSAVTGEIIPNILITKASASEPIST